MCAGVVGACGVLGERFGTSGLGVVLVRGVVNLDSIFALMIFLIFFGFVSNYVLQMSGKSASATDLRSARERAYIAMLEDGSLLDQGGRTAVLVSSGGARKEYFWLKWGSSGLSAPSAYDPVFGEVVGFANLSAGSNWFELSGAPGNAGGNLSFDGAFFSNSQMSFSTAGMNISDLRLGGEVVASSMSLGPAPLRERSSNLSLRAKIAGGNYSWGFFDGEPEIALEYEATGNSTMNLSIALDPSLVSVYANGTASCTNFTGQADFIDVYGSRGLAVSGDPFLASCSGGVLRITKQASFPENGSGIYAFRLYAHGGDYTNALKYRGLPVVASGLPFRTRMFLPSAVSGISGAYCGRIRDAVNANLGLWLSFRMGNGTYECRTDNSSSTQDIVVSKKAVAYSDGGRGSLYVRVWYK